MAYTLEQFGADCGATLKKDDTHTGRQRIKGLLEKLLSERDFVEKYCGPDATPGVHLLYADPATDVHVLAHIYDKPRVSPPHDHGESWAIYGQAIAYTDMTDWALTGGNADRERPDVRAVRSYRLFPGMAGTYDDGKIHSIDYPAGARFIRVTGTDLDKIKRRVYTAAQAQAAE
jgi:predicted metal-dependent enzyme (double-stranded beta helix superfamily)